MHQARIGRAVLSRRRVDARDPEAPKIALATFTVGVRVHPRLHHDFLRVCEEARPGAVVALGELQHAIAAAAGFESSFCAGHGRLLSRREEAV